MHSVMHPARKSSVGSPWFIKLKEIKDFVVHEDTEAVDPRKVGQANGTHWNDITFVIGKK